MLEAQLASVSVFRNLHDGREWIFSDFLATHPAYVIGSDPRSPLQLRDLSVAPSHAVITRRGDEFHIASCFPHLKVHLNGQPLRVRMALRPGDRISVGAVTLIYELRERPVATPVGLVPARIPAGTVITKRSGLTLSALAAGPAPAPVVSNAQTAVYFPPRPGAASGTSSGAVLTMLLTLAIIVGVIGYGLLNGSAVTANAGSGFALNSGRATILMFEAGWCKYCKQQKPIVEGLAREYQGDLNVKYVDIDARANRDVVAEYNATAIPYLVILNDRGRVVRVFRGLTSTRNLRQAVDLALEQSAKPGV